MKFRYLFIILTLLSFLSCEKNKKNDMDDILENTGTHISKIYPFHGKLNYHYNNRIKNRFGEYFISGSTFDSLKYYYYPPKDYYSNIENGVFLQKFDKSNNLLWQKTWKKEKSSYVTFSNDKGAFIGTYNGNIIIRKIDANGIVLWKKEIGGDEPDNIYSMVSTKDGGIICTGKTESYNDKSYGDIITFKLSTTGEILWQNIYENNEQEIPHDVILTGDGGCLVVGENNDKDYYPAVLIIIKYDKYGKRTWVKNFKLNDWTVGMSAIMLLNKDFIIGGRSYKSETFSNSFLLCIDNNGNKKWFKEMDKYDHNEFGILIVPVNNYEFIFIVKTIDKLHFTRFNNLGEELAEQSFDTDNTSVYTMNEDYGLTIFFNFEKLLSDTLKNYIDYKKIKL